MAHKDLWVTVRLTANWSIYNHVMFKTLFGMWKIAGNLVSRTSSSVRGRIACAATVAVMSRLASRAFALQIRLLPVHSSSTDSSSRDEEFVHAIVTRLHPEVSSPCPESPQNVSFIPSSCFSPLAALPTYKLLCATTASHSSGAV